MATELNKENFKAHISSGLAFVDFWAPWCGPCQMLMPVIEELSKEMKGVKIGKVNVDENPELSAEYQVSGIPTMILFKDGKMIDKRVGAGTKAGIKGWLEEHMKK
ncbi:thioredoxin [Candidatus Micrarchaeota archaeon CG10_big_fil_rev_8_21_14_0_10_45_29]|nr:MAG: thioredoxin [Candidatus Micrarchaeota archaeon CG10_big_fil_rev_8_21_14_0_10_45_29]